MISGRYINLDSSSRRRIACDSELKKKQIPDYHRLPAIDGCDAHSEFSSHGYSPGKLGCWLSHLKVLEQSLGHDDHQHILEDDFIFTSVFKAFHRDFERLISSLPEWDIIFCDVDLAGLHNVALMGSLIRRVSELEESNRVAFEDATKLYTAGNSSYIVNRCSKEKVYGLMKDGFESGLPNDLYLRKLIREGQVKAYVTLPFVTSVSDDFNDSTILGDIGTANPSIMLATLYRRSLAWGADTKQLLETFRTRINQLSPVGDRGMIYAHLVAHLVSDDYQSY